MKISFAKTLLATLAVAALTSSTFAHDDAKVRDRMKPYRGPGWREVDGKPIDGSVAGAFDSNGVQLRSWLPLADLSPAATSGNSCWGYVAPNGAEFAIIGLSSGTAFVDITNPGAATLKAFITGPTSLWRDVRVFNGFCYAASEAGSGIQVMNIGRLHIDGVVTLVGTVLEPTATTAATHTLALDEVSGYLYRAGGGATGLRIYDLNVNPGAPTYVGAWSTVYVHEAQVKTFTTGPYAGRQIAFCCGGQNSGNVNTGLYVVDVTNKAAPVQLSYTTYPNARYCHQGWLDEQQQYFYINDELDEGNTVTVTTTIVLDVTNLSAPTFAGTFTNGNAAVGHNLFVRGSLLYEANYRSGMRVFDLSVSRLNPPEKAFFDTFPGSDTAQFNGLWNIWPFFPSGTVIGSDIERGLFVWTIQDPFATYSVAAPPATINPAGGSTVNVTIAPIGNAVLNPASASMTTTWGTSSVTSALTSLGGNNYRGTFPAIPCLTTANYSFQIQNSAGATDIDPATRSALAVISQTTIVNSEFETADGWVGGAAGDTATAGIWTRVDPVGTIAQPELDHSVSGTICWVTGQGVVGGADGAADVDGGITTLLSPIYNLTSIDDPVIEYWYWYSNNQGGAPNADSMPIQISADGGTTWVTMLDLATSNNTWSRHQWRVRDFITPTANVRVRFVARDLATGSLVEAAIDDFKITNTVCTASVPGDINGDGFVNGGDLAALLNGWGSPGASDLDGNGTTDAADLSIVLNNWT
ncbi:MAG: hypothetical protein RLZZ116_2335 [Planctomycetota bacterium]|jgi:choice-of-anchor B domain-containing protein